ncbi:unknown [Cercopithecine alphaherpesvirus 9]|uniref:Inner tegument protein n=2 Tax=Cercopithecine alphaherpesvirus 9 TaxID=35246 RepID=A0A2D0TCK2_CHV9D|nr:tegument protein UL37 [Cercopithecine alphaherpesvirus 9]AAC55822.1 SVV21 [Cercopithecine alphaherpesvirus 9]AAG27194.1 unknown [Cercopithecine alphaherpesvirus 9]
MWFDVFCIVHPTVDIMETAITQNLLNDLKSLSSKDDSSETIWPPEKVETARISIVKFLRSTQEIPLENTLWTELHKVICNVYAHTFLIEASFLAENLPGLIFWKLESHCTQNVMQHMETLKQLCNNIQSRETLQRLTLHSLRTSAKLGPVSINSLVTDWINMFEVAVRDINEATKLPFLYARQGMVESAVAALTHQRFALLYDMPIVQDGLRILTQRASWLIPFTIMWSHIQSDSFTPLTKCLFIINLADEYFDDTPVSYLTDLFNDNIIHVKDIAFVPIEEAIVQATTVHGARINAALAHQNLSIRQTQPGTATHRLRVDVNIWDNNILSLSAPGIHIDGLLHLITTDPTAETTAGAAVAECVRVAWERVQASTSPNSLVLALLEAGFTRYTCKLLRKFVTHCTLGLHSLYDTHITHEVCKLTDFQQTIGCVSLVGGLAYQLLETYAPTAHYVSTYTHILSETEKRYETLIPALGLPPGGLGQIMRRCFAPRPLISSIQLARKTLVEEINTAETRKTVLHLQHTRETQPGARVTREAILTWFDFRMESRWGINPPVDTQLSPPINTTVPTTGIQSAMIKAAMDITYPSKCIYSSILETPSFVPYVISTCVYDALYATTNCFFGPEGIKQVLSVLIWARDYGSGFVPNADGYRTKLCALITLLEPFSQQVNLVILPGHVAAVESLLRELYQTVIVAIELLPQHVRPVLPEIPSITSSIFLATLYYDELFSRFKRFKVSSVALMDNFMTNTLKIQRSMLQLRKFFACQFISTVDPQVVCICHPNSTKANMQQIGMWTLKDVVDAIMHVIDNLQGVRTQMRIDLSAFRTITTETSAALQDCETLMTKTSTCDSINLLFSTLASRYAHFTQEQLDVLLRVNKLVCGNCVPGLGNVDKFLTRWKNIISAFNRATTSPCVDFIASAIGDIKTVIENVYSDRTSTPEAYLKHARGMDNHNNAVMYIMNDKPQTTPNVSDTSGEILTSHVNINDWTSVNVKILTSGIRTPQTTEAIHNASSVLIEQRWLMIDEILSEVDAYLGLLKTK